MSTSDLSSYTESMFARLGPEYQSRKEASEIRAIEWRWYTRSWFDVLPLIFERYGWPPGRRLRNSPIVPSGHVQNGFDANQRVVVEREFNKFGAYETFYNWGPKSVEVAHFNYLTDKSPIFFMVLRFENGRPLDSFKSASKGYTFERYAWDDSDLRKIRVEHAVRCNGALSDVEHRHDALIDYDARGRVERVTLSWPPSPQRAEKIDELMYERRGKRIFRART